MGSTFVLSLRGFIGVEWFVAPKVSIGAEYGWGLHMQSTGEGTRTVEEYKLLNNATAESLQTREEKIGGTSSFAIDTDNNDARLKLLFHF